MRVEITKDFIVKALDAERVELLRPGMWFGIPSSDGKRPELPKELCIRCAVGSVVNRMLAPTTESYWIFQLSGRVTSGDLVAPGYHEHRSYEDLEEFVSGELGGGQVQPMSALSYFFEAACMIEGSRRRIEVDDLDEYSQEKVNEMISEARARTIEFVRDHFPEKMEVDINGHEPAQDVARVE